MYSVVHTNISHIIYKKIKFIFPSTLTQPKKNHLAVFHFSFLCVFLCLRRFSRLHLRNSRPWRLVRLRNSFKIYYGDVCIFVMCMFCVWASVLYQLTQPSPKSLSVRSSSSYTLHAIFAYFILGCVCVAMWTWLITLSTFDIRISLYI